MFSSFVLFALLHAAVAQYDWMYGRATFYGNEPWYWSIHRGSCGYGYICKDEGTGWDVAALSDQHWAYSYSCGLCFEFKCNPADFQDGYGQTLDRKHVCYDPEASTVATTVDTCPCNYANNAYSNRRWCCGDTDHFDLSVWAFEKLADTKWGVISVYYRQVPCNQQPYKQAYAPNGEHWGEDPGSYGATCPRNNIPRYYDSSINQEQPQDSQEQEKQEYLTEDTQEPEAATSNYMEHSSVSVLYSGDGDGQFYLDSWNAEAWEIEGAGVNGGKAICGKVFPGGAISLAGGQGQFSGKMTLEFWTKVDQGLANAALNVQGSSGEGCDFQMFYDMQVKEYQGDYAKYAVILEEFVHGDDPVDTSRPFQGCNQMTAEDIQRVSFHNYENYEQYFCIDEVILKDGF